MVRFTDRKDGADKLLVKLKKFEGDRSTIVAGLPRGGVVTASVIAGGLRLPLGYLIVKKIGAPNNSELAVGAVADGGVIFIDSDITQLLNISDQYLSDEIEKKREEIRRKIEFFGTEFLAKCKDKTVIIADDGIATGATMIAAIRMARNLGARKVVVASPAGACSQIGKLRREADEILCLGEDLEAMAVGSYYKNFPQVTDDEVRTLLINAKNYFHNE